MINECIEALVFLFHSAERLRVDASLTILPAGKGLWLGGWEAFQQAVKACSKLSALASEPLLDLEISAQDSVVSYSVISSS